MVQAVQPRTAATRERHASELQHWLATEMPGSSTAHCSPVLLAVYIMQHWLPNHAGSVLPVTGEHIAKPASLTTMLSHLSSFFEVTEGRVGAYRLLDGVQHGNPVLSPTISQLSKGYANAMLSKGVSQGAAVPVSFDQVAQLLQHLHAALRESEPGTLHAYLLARDGFLISVLWHTALRGDNAVRLRSSGFITDDGTAALTQQWARSDPMQGTTYHFRVDVTKSRRSANCGRATIEVLSPHDQHLCCARWLQQLHLEYFAACQEPLEGYLTRPLCRNLKEIAEHPMSSSGLNQMLKGRAAEAGVPGGLTPHGFRRGQIQQQDNNGVSLAAITQGALNSSESVIQKRYLNRDAHLNNLKRARR